MASELRIGQLATATGVSRFTIRYYEKFGLLPPARRSVSGYRLYLEEDVQRLLVIKQAQRLGFSLDEIRELLSRIGRGLTSCLRTRDMLVSKIEKIDIALVEVHAFRQSLAHYLDACEETIAGKREGFCPVLFELRHPVPKWLHAKR
jgi:DNA-binding transcriptional MerR regulator